MQTQDILLICPFEHIPPCELITLGILHAFVHYAANRIEQFHLQVHQIYVLSDQTQSGLSHGNILLAADDRVG
jgi:hypothetical protein